MFTTQQIQVLKGNMNFSNLFLCTIIATTLVCII